MSTHDPSEEQTTSLEYRDEEPATVRYDADPEIVHTEPYDDTLVGDGDAAQDQPAYPSFWEHQEPAIIAQRSRGRGRGFLAWFMAVLFGAGGGFAGTWFAVREGVIEPRANGAAVNVVAPPVRGTGAPPQSQVAAVARALLPSVVRIDVQGSIGAGIGSGVIYRADGYIVTNEHVVSGANSIRVALSTGERLDAALIGTARSIDIAVIKVTKTGLPAAVFGSTRDLEVGDLAVAIGSPFGLSSTVTAGVISALHRNELAQGGDRTAPDLVQTDAPINRGNSGGALANARGEVIGINQSIASSGGGSEGVGFAIPIDLVRKVADQIIASGSAVLPKLGIEGSSVPDDGGALIQRVETGGPAARAGIRVGDVIIAFDGQRVTSMGGLIALILDKKPGDTVTIDLRRDDQATTVRATLASRPAD